MIVTVEYGGGVNYNRYIGSIVRLMGSGENQSSVGGFEGNGSAFFIVRMFYKLYQEVN